MPLRRRYPTYRSVARRRRISRKGYANNRAYGGALARNSRTHGALQRASVGGMIKNFQLWKVHPFPPRHYFDMPYYQNAFNYDCGAAGIGGTEQVWRLNSLYDPDLTGGGHSAYYQSQLINIYRKYCVTHVTVKVQVKQCTYASSLVVCQIQTSSSTQVLTGATVNSACERPGSIQLYGPTATQGHNMGTFTRKFSIPEIEGIPWTQFVGDVSNYHALMGANPTLTPYMRVAAFDMNGLNTDTCIIATQFIFHGFMYDRIDQTGS